MKSSSRTTHPVLLFINLYFFSFQEPSFFLYFFTLREGFTAVVPLCAEMITTRSNFVFQTKRGAFSLHLLQQQHPSSRSDYFLTLPHHHPDRVAFFYYIALFCLFKDLPSPTPSKHSLLSNLHVPKMETTHFVVATSLILSLWTRLADFEQLDVH